MRISAISILIGVAIGLLASILVCAIFGRGAVHDNRRHRSGMVVNSFLGKGFGNLIAVDGYLVNKPSTTKCENPYCVLVPVGIDGDAFEGYKSVPVGFFTAAIGEDVVDLNSNDLVTVFGYETFSADGAPCSIAEYVDVPQMMGGWGLSQFFMIVKIAPAVK